MRQRASIGWRATELAVRMSTVHLDGRRAAHSLSDIAPTGCSGRLAECSRLEWRCGDDGDPALLLAGFLAGTGLSRPDASDLSSSVSAGRKRHAEGDLCGVAVFVSAAGGAAMIGAPAGAPSPAPAVPDLAAVAFAH